MASVDSLPTSQISPALAEQGQLPAGFPSCLDSKLAFTGADYADESKYVYWLTESDVTEINAALQHFKSLELNGSKVSRETFPLGALGRVLDGLSEEIHEGRGFGLIRGLDPRNYSVEDLTLAYLGVQSYVADQRGRQDSKGNMLVHVVEDRSSETAKNHHRHSNKSITFHNEEDGDVVGWLTRGQASEGGSCVISSCYAIYNLVASTRPDLIAALASPFTFAIPRLETRPALFMEGGRLIVNFGRTPLLGSDAHPRDERLPKPTEQQLAALDVVEEIAHRIELRITTQPGDMHFINNLAILHRRDAFNNGGNKRHLVRVRCRSTRLGWAIPKDLKAAWGGAFGPSARSESWNLEPRQGMYFPLRDRPN
ncbi:hypothetical protein RB595_000884 [Gaeumannomyces hyphopodioides]